MPVANATPDGGVTGGHYPLTNGAFYVAATVNPVLNPSILQPLSFLGFASSCGPSWRLLARRVGVLPTTTFYPFRHPRCREPDSMFARRRTEKRLGGQPHLISGACNRHQAA